MLLTLLGMFNDISIVFANAWSPIIDSCSGRAILVILVPAKAPLPKAVIVVGSETAVRPLHKQNACSPIEETPYGMVILVKEVQL